MLELLLNGYFVRSHFLPVEAGNVQLHKIDNNEDFIELKKKQALIDQLRLTLQRRRKHSLIAYLNSGLSSFNLREVTEQRKLKDEIEAPESQRYAVSRISYRTNNFDTICNKYHGRRRKWSYGSFDDCIGSFWGARQRRTRCQKKAFHNLHYGRAHKNSFAFCFEANNTYKIVESREVLCDFQNPLSFRFAFRWRLAFGHVCQHFKPFKPENFDLSYLIGN